MIYENATVKYWYRYPYHVSEHFDLPLAQMIVRNPRLFNDESFDFAGNTGKMHKADKVWLQVNNEPIRVIKARDGDMKFDEDEFTRMLFVAEQTDVVSLAP